MVLAERVRAHWEAGDVRRLLGHDETDVRCAAALVLGLIGGREDREALARALHDRDCRVSQMAEHALWSIWFRSGAAKAAEPFQQGLALLARNKYEGAIRSFRRATALDSAYAEAFNQCAIAHYFLGQWREAIADCCRAIRLEPLHFGAIVGMGHCYAQLGDAVRAVRCYRRALGINPLLEGLSNAIEDLERLGRDIAGRDRVGELDSSGEFQVDEILA